MKITGNAEALSFESDDRGWELHLTTSDGDEVAVNIHAVALELAGSDGFKAFMDWVREAEWSRRAFELQRSAMGILEPDDDDGYAPDDPKHHNWHSVHSDIWDARSGK